MSTSVTDCSIVLNNKRIFSFYNENKHINVESANLLLIDFFESMLNHITSDTNINSQLLSFITDNKIQIDTIKSNLNVINENITKLNTDITNSMMIQFMNLKKEHIDDIRLIVNNSSLTINEKVSSLLDKQNTNLIDKTALILNDIMPKNNEQCSKQIHENFKTLHLLLKDDAAKLATSNNAEKSLNDFISNFETKYNAMMQTIQQPLYSVLAASEDRITKNIENIKMTTVTNASANEKVINELEEFLGKYKGSTNKGKYGEQQLFSTLNGIYNIADITNTSGTKASGDFIMKRVNKPTIMFETKAYDYNVPKEEIVKFLRDIEVQNMSGIFLSQHSGISLKYNYQIDIHKGNVLVYIHNCDYDPDKIKIAVDIIDNLFVKIKEMNIDDESNISKETLDGINTEYQLFITQKENMLMIIKDFQKRITAQIDDLTLPVLDKYLETKYAGAITKPKTKTFTCDLCNVFTTDTKQGISAHKRGCQKKTVLENSIVIDKK